MARTKRTVCWRKELERKSINRPLSKGVAALHRLLDARPELHGRCMTLEELCSNKCVKRHFKTGVLLVWRRTFCDLCPGLINIVTCAGSTLKKTLLEGRLGELEAEEDISKGTFKIFKKQEKKTRLLHWLWLFRSRCNGEGYDIARKPDMIRRLF